MARTQINASLVPSAATASANADISIANFQGNFIDNGGFEVWQRGTSFTNPGAAAYTADRWQNNFNGVPVLNITRDSTVTDGSPFSWKWALTSVGGGTVFRMRQSIEASQLAGKTVTVSARVRVDSGGGGFVFVDLNDTNGQTPFVPANATVFNNGTWETISVTRTLGANVTTLNFEFNFNNVPGVCYIDNVMGVIGSTPVSFVPFVPQVDLARCQRFYEVSGPTYGVTFRALGMNNGSQYQLSQYVPFKVTKRILPTMTITGAVVWEEGSQTNQVANYGFNAANADQAGFEFEAGKGVGGNKPTLLQGSWTASADF